MKQENIIQYFIFTSNQKSAYEDLNIGAVAVAGAGGGSTAVVGAGDRSAVGRQTAPAAR